MMNIRKKIGKNKINSKINRFNKSLWRVIRNCKTLFLTKKHRGYRKGRNLLKVRVIQSQIIHQIHPPMIMNTIKVSDMSLKDPTI
jgi:hypothetical protein